MLVSPLHFKVTTNEFVERIFSQTKEINGNLLMISAHRE